MPTERTIDVINRKESANLIKGIIVFDTNINLDEGILGIVLPVEDNDDKVILNPYYKGGELKLRMKIVSSAPNRFEIGDKIATLVLLD